MVNLLPISDRHALTRSYYLRLGALFLFMFSIVAFAGGLLLLPSFFLARGTADAGERYLAALEETVGLRERAGVADEMQALQERVRIMRDAHGGPMSLGVLEALGKDVPGISVSGIAFAREGEGAKVSISGVAGTRAALLSFSTRIRENPAFSDVVFPVSQLAGEEDIPFSISAVYRGTPL